MVNGKEHLAGHLDVPCRMRGRPPGKNRIPLSLEERRVRNAQYERERRNQTAEVMSELAEAVNCDSDISNADLLATVISRIQRATRNKSEDITVLERINANLEAQIATLQSRLGLDDASFELLDKQNNDMESNSLYLKTETMNNTYNRREHYKFRNRTKKRKRSEQQSSENDQQEKRTKTKSETWSIDSGIELRGHTISPPAVCVQDNKQYLIKSEQQLPEEITEEDPYVSEAHMELQTELYNEIYNSESQSSVETMPDGTSSKESIPCMTRLFRSLVAVPTIVPPQELYDFYLSQQTQQELPNLQNVEPPCDSNIANECDFQPQDEQPTLDILTDIEKRLLKDWIGPEFFGRQWI